MPDSCVPYVGLSVVIVGVTPPTTNGNVPESCASGLSTLTLNVPPVATSVAGTDAVSCVALTKVVVSAEPAHSTFAPVTNEVPLTVSVNAAPPTTPVLGAREISAGAGNFV